MSTTANPIPVLRPLIAVALAATVLATLAGCGKSMEDAATEAAVRAASDGKLEVERDGDRMTFTGEDGSKATVSHGDDLDLPAGFPNDVWRPADYRVRSVVDADGMWMIGMSSDSPVDALRRDAGERMAAQGWKQVMAMEHENGAMLAWEKDERHAALSFGREGDASMISVQLREAP